VGQAETRIFDVGLSTDEHFGDCGGGLDVVLRFELTKHANVEVSALQFGDHLVGLFRDIGGACTDWPMDCFDLAGQKSATKTWVDLEPGVYFVVIDARTPSSADTVAITLTMRTSACGNGYLDPGEECDDGNLVPDDGCSPICLREISQCLLDEDLGVLEPSVLIRRTLSMWTYGDEWVTECSPYGYDYVLSFEMQRTADVVLNFSQQGSHAVGLYQDGQVERFLCQAQGGVCVAREPGQPGGVIFRNRPAGTYYLISESVGYEDAGVLDLSLRISGCRPHEDLGVLAKGAVASRSSTTSSSTGLFDAGCGGSSGNEIVYAFQLSETTRLDLEFQQTGDHVFGLFLEQGGDCDANQVACFDPGSDTSGATSFPRLSAGSYLLIVDAFDPGTEGAFQITLSGN
jgi:cysteine-rich repeat protein